MRFYQKNSHKDFFWKKTKIDYVYCTVDKVDIDR